MRRGALGADTGDRLRAVRMGTFDGDPGIRPSYRQFTAYAAVWEPIPDDGLPATRSGGLLPDARPRHAPTVVPGIGEKVIRELVGNVNTGTARVSVARMTSPPGWEEPAQTPEFDEVTVVLEGAVVVEHDGGEDHRAARRGGARPRGRARPLLDAGGRRVHGDLRPAFTPDTAHRDE